MNRSLIRTWMGRSLLAAMVLALAPALWAATPQVLDLETGTQRLHRANSDITRVAVGNPAIADVNIVNRRDFLVTGKALGLTSLIVWTKAEPAPREYRLRVISIRDPERPIVVDPELSETQIDEGHGMTGKLPNLLAHRRAAIAGQAGVKEGSFVDRSEVTLDTQVMTSIKIAEVSRTTAQRYGLNVMVNNPGASQTSGGIFVPGGHGSSTMGNINGGTLSSAVSNAFGLVVTDASKNIMGILNLLEGRGLARTLAEPSLLAMSGQTASFLAGGEFPVPISQGGATAGGISIEYKEFGVRLNLSPTVLSRDRIALKVAPEVSELDYGAAIQVGGVAVPALRVRRTETTVELGDGESFLLSGLVNSQMSTNVDKLPWLADIPILGAFFKSNSISREDRELVMVVTPRLVRPLAKGANLPKLPGAEYDGYNPGMAQTVFMENGEFDSGFSR
ncbi:type II and III secretion system protein family protein [Sinimarinibacterium sp. NLF-5-8]|uniref:type II and III secretion system protein family protein n=1 Tax=Sinimarinibacterium sp. NLF-5-8 TaxID=2698684 RepID=UPI00137C2AEC|nr:type II and III secretion system protein family protein [Sinimarinibacterium sp. NLF-5-8]QHS09312.1 type II and III secretion system protein family protein [Sinimarinibacterium sp. NLF-5-8]